MSVDVTRKARSVMVCGGSGTGKSAWVKQQIAKTKRLLIWDTEGEYLDLPKVQAVQGQRALTSLLLRHPVGPARIAYVPRTLKDFEFWARCALAWKNCTVVAEELADVTTPGKAQDGWGQLVRKGRKHGVEIYAITQRPAESDKTVIGNATLTHCCAMKRAKDRDYMAAEMNCDRTLMNALKPLEWIEADEHGGMTKGKMKF
jgi:hypothetical protein